jgi:ubiquitin carboxyl-terminal hydrolase 4/11/15
MRQGTFTSLGGTLFADVWLQVSITFDPFMYLTLPLPVTKTWQHTIHYVPWDSSKPPLAVEIEVPKDSSYGYLKKMFGRWFGVPPENVSKPSAADFMFTYRIDIFLAL